MAREFLVDSGIEVFDVKRVQKIDGAIRAKYIPALPNDFWLITFSRSTAILPSCGGETEEEQEIIAAVAEKNDQVTVAVEHDGSLSII